MSEYPFLVLSLLLLLPGALIFALRADLRRPMGWMALCSVPFAFTELLFYPDYWAPRFLFDLVNIIGFGIEDLLFVTGLAAFTSTGYAFVARRRFAPVDGATTPRQIAARAAALLVVVFVAVAATALAAIPMIYASVVIMVAVTALMVVLRRDLLAPAWWGAWLSVAVYTALCLVLEILIPDIFDLAWNTERFLDRYVLGVPVEELLYAWGAGAAATAFYPFAAGQRLVALRPG